MPNSTVVDVTYDDPRTGERIRERRIQEIPYEDLDNVRNQELALVSERDADRYRKEDRRQSDDEQIYYDVRRTTRQRNPSGSVPPLRRYYEDPRYYRSSRPSSDYDQREYQRQRRNRSRYDNDDYESSRERDHRRRNRRARSDRGARDEGGSQERLWYSGKERKDANIIEKTFDSSYDGIIAGVAGAAIGALTARHFAEEDKHKKWKTLGAAVAGGAAANAAENRYRMYTEERERKGQDHMEAREPMEFLGEAGLEV
ncbi:hypothetical protein B0A50_08443 [Salinomyces thailandicus]|uniref:Uncharacterized protein n=1 Tax=Salinomyces thailandicus TaxID=706561 RepID=A0A4U0TJP3_9PEZI|nr:hypothetical protein B0A50_08443 [Salinomyces thailandica]